MGESFQSNQLCSPHPQRIYSFINHCQPPLPCREYRTLWCFIGGDREPFKVVLCLNVDVDVDDLKQVIYTSIDTTCSTVPPKDLILWKLSELEPLEPNDTFAHRVAIKLSKLPELQVATKLGPSQKLSVLFPQELPQNCLHIMAQVPSGSSRKRASSTDNDDQHRKKLRTGEIVPNVTESPSISDNTLDPSSSDFSSLVKSGAFVDKSTALQDFLHVATPMHLLLRPRRSGKTTLLRMLRAFLELTSLDEQAQRRKLFENLAIAKDVRFKTEFGKYPVLYLDLSNTMSDTMAGMLRKFKSVVIRIVQNLDDSNHFQNQDTLPKHRRKFLNRLLNGETCDSEWSNVLLDLTEILHMLHSKKVILLIDEYDTPLSHAAKFPYFPEANEFFRDVFSSLLKNNIYLRGAVLVGIVDVGKGSLLSGLNNITTYHLGATERYSTACMFTENETRVLYDHQNKIKKLPFTFKELEKWYNGYSAWDGSKLFNPWSVSNALIQGHLGQWWTKSGYDETIQARIAALLDGDDDFQSKCQDLLNGKSIEIKIELLNYTLMPTLSKEQLWTFMYYTGYLTQSKSSSESERIVCIPNFEITSEFREWIRTDFDHRMTRAGYGPSLSLFDDMVNANFSEFSKSFGDFVLTAMPQRIFGSNERVYHDYVFAYFLGAMRAMDGSTSAWTARMEIPAGDGRADIIFHDDKKGAIFELKRISHPKKEGYRNLEESQLSKATNEALGQCDTRHYRASMPEGVSSICEYGIAFLGPYCAVEARMLERKAGNLWITQTEYSSSDDEIRRKNTYIRQEEL